MGFLSSRYFHYSSLLQCSKLEARLFFFKFLASRLRKFAVVAQIRKILSMGKARQKEKVTIFLRERVRETANTLTDLETFAFRQCTVRGNGETKRWPKPTSQSFNRDIRSHTLNWTKLKSPKPFLNVRCSKLLLYKIKKQN